MERKVLVYTNTTSGIKSYNADYGSWEVTSGLDAEYSKPIGNSATKFTAGIGIDVINEYIDAFSETEYFRWEIRSMLRGITKAAIGLHHIHNNGIQTHAIASTHAREVLAGKTTKFTMDGTPVSFSGGRYNVAITQINLGATYQANDNLQLSFNLHAAASNHKTDTFGAPTRLNWKF